MADLFVITPPVVRAEGKDVPPEQIQAGFNSLARQTQIGLNSVASDPTGPASGDLGGVYPAPTVVAVHAIGGTLDGVVIGGTTPAAGSFTTLAASTPVAVTSGGTGQNALNAHNVIIGEGSSAVGFAAPGTAGRMLISTGTTTDPAFANNPVITGGTIDNAAIGQTTPAAGNFTTLASTGGAVNGTVGATTPNTGSFTTLTASSTVSGTGFVNRFSSPGPIGNTAASTGAFTTLSSTGTFTPSSTNGIVGTTTNDNANAGSVGELLTNATTGTSLSTGVSANVTSVSLTAGDWDVTAQITSIPAGGTTTTFLAGGINTTTATLPAGNTGASFQIPGSSTAGVTIAGFAGPFRVSLATTTTVFAVANVTFGGSTMTANGFIRARRVR